MTMRTVPGEKSTLDDHYVFRPHVSFTAKELPELRDWKPGKKYKLEVEVEMKSLNAPGDRFGRSDKTPMSGDFVVTKVGTVEPPKEMFPGRP